MKNKLCSILLLLTTSLTFLSVSAQQKTKAAHPAPGVNQKKDQPPVDNQTQEVPDLSNFRVHADQMVIKVGQTSTLTVQWLNNILASLTDPSDVSSLLAPLVKEAPKSEQAIFEQLVKENAMSDKWMPLPPKAYTQIKWEISSGPGKITVNPSDPAKAKFTSPSSISANTTTYITATITGLAFHPMEEKSIRTKSVVKLTIPIMIIEGDQYVIFGFDGKVNFVNGDGETGSIYHKPGDEFSIKVSMSGGRELLLFTDAYKEGFFPYGNDEKNDMVAGMIVHAGLAKENKKYGSSYSVPIGNCHNCEERYSAGGVHITKIEEVGEEIKLTKAELEKISNGTASDALYQKMAQQVGNAKTTYVEGTFQGVVYLQEGDDPKPIAGKFRVKAW